MSSSPSASRARSARRSGGLPRVQALGLFLDDLECAQVSMNLLDYSVTPIWRVWEAVREAAAHGGRRAAGVGADRALPRSRRCSTSPTTSDVDAGLPDEERITAAAAWLQIRDFEPTMALELRLAEAERGAMTRLDGRRAAACSSTTRPRSRRWPAASGAAPPRRTSAC